MTSIVLGLSENITSTDIIVGIDPNNPVVPFPFAPGVLTVDSTNDEDRLGLTGASICRIESIWLKPTGSRTVKYSTVILKGQTLVSVTEFTGDPGENEKVRARPGIEGVYRIRSMTIVASDDKNFSPKGDVTAYIDGLPVSRIIAGQGRSKHAIWSTPTGSIERVKAAEITMSHISGGGSMQASILLQPSSKIGLQGPWIDSRNPLVLNALDIYRKDEILVEFSSNQDIRLKLFNDSSPIVTVTVHVIVIIQTGN